MAFVKERGNGMKSNIKNKRMKMIWSFARPYKITFVNLFICIIVTSFIGMLYPYIFGLLIDEVFYHRNIQFFKVIVVIYCILYVGEQSLHLVLNYLAAYFATKFNFDIKNKIYEKIISLKADYLSNIHTGDLITRINKDADQIYEFIHWNVFYLIANIIRLFLSILFVAFLNIKLAVVMLIIVPVSVYISRHFSKKVKQQLKSYREGYGKYISWVFEMISGMREVQLFAAERHTARKFVLYCSKLIHLQNKTSIYELKAERTISFVALISDLCIYTAAAVLIIRGELTVGAFIAAIDYFSKANSLLKGINDANMKIQNNMVSIDKVSNLLEEEDEREAVNTAIAITDGKIEYSNVFFKYNEENEVLEGINLVINKGEKISIVGKSGAGKSTMASLLLRFYNPTDGNIQIDGQDINNLSLKSLRKNIGIVQQECLIFNGSIRYNLTLGNPRVTDEEVWEACRKAYIDDVIRNLPDGLDTIVGNEGINLSGGQKQRIAIARIFIKNPKILVLDEATSALDFEAESIIKKAARELSKGRSTIVIAHRLSTILDSDKVAVLKDGKIVAYDHHKKLLENCEFYGHLFREQYLGKEGEAV